MSAAFAHDHLAKIGWALMMAVGLSYRLLPIIVPAAMPRARDRGDEAAAALCPLHGKHRLARWILLTWTFGVPLLTGGLAFTLLPLVRVGSVFLLAGVILNAAQATVIATAQVSTSR